MIPIDELDLVEIGEIIKTHGYKGEAVVKLSIRFDKLKKTELIFLITDGNKVPFFFSYPPKAYKKSGMLVKFDNIDTDKDIEKLTGCKVLTEKKNIKKTYENEIFIPENFDVFDNEKFIGKSGTYLNIPSNPILTVYSPDNKEILIPVNDKFLKSINIEKKIIIFDLPDGLTDINK
ncbi:MAG: 16S rRNA processing protein RimM [Chlorobi bacterium]|nr:16S rRNA processing protein RimM [Chlorobiota bacterium]